MGNEPRPTYLVPIGVRLRCLALIPGLFVTVLVALLIMALASEARAVDPPTALESTAVSGTNSLTGKLVTANGTPLPIVPVDGGSDIWVFDADGSNGVNLTGSFTDDRNMGTFENEPVWSRDGTQIAFTSGCCRSGSWGKLWVMNADGSSPRRVTSDSASDVWFTPETDIAWSPDGSHIAFMRDGQGYTIRVDGTDEQAIPGIGWLDVSWSPNSDWLVYTHPSFIEPLMLVKTDGSSLTPLPTSGKAASPQWSSGGEWIVYTECKDVALDCSGSRNRELRKMRPDGTDDQLLTSDAWFPTWSPDGSTILFQRNSDVNIGNANVLRYFTIPADGGTVIEMTIDYPKGTLPFGTAYWQPIPLSDHPAVVGLVDPSQGKWYLYDDAGALVSLFFFGNPGDYPIVGDWDGDGIETPGMYRQSDGYVYLRNSNTQGVADIKFFFGDPGDLPIAGDFNGDGLDTVSIYRPSNQTFYIINKLGENNGGLGAAESSYIFGNPGDKPFVGDFDGDGIETVGLHRESTGLVYFRNTHTQGNADVQFIYGDPGDRIVAGDWNSNGVFSPALFRGSNTTMYFRYTNSQGNTNNQFVPMLSGSGWLPVAGTFG